LSRIFGEKGEGDDFLAISPLRKLAADNRGQLPVAVVVGAKGAGKTYTYLQALRYKDWAGFASAAGESRTTVNGVICPALRPKSLSDSAPGLVDKARQRASAELQFAEQLDWFGVEDLVREWLRESLHEGEWRERWLDLMAWAAGFEIRKPGAGRRLSSHLGVRGQRLLFVMDGLEELFASVSKADSEQLALRALLQEVPNWLMQQPERSIGAVFFVRRDMVASAIRQNFAQFIARYEPYGLKWDSAEALRLVLWIGGKARLWTESSGAIQQMGQDQVVEKLIPLWGQKLGSDKSREGRSAEWVIAALSDFRGQIQARDVVRFLHVAAKRSIGTTLWADRILAPSAIRDAVADCSVEKIQEIRQENIPLAAVLDKLNALDPNKKQVPFEREDVNLDATELQLLELNGVVVSDEGSFYMPEIFRRGLNFGLPRGARPKVLALARRRQSALV
jgi:hypothetical protein